MRNEILQILGGNTETSINESYIDVVSHRLMEMASGKSLSRIQKHFNDPDTEVVVVSGERHKEGETPEQKSARNERQTAMLKKHLDDNNFSYVKAKGGYIENYGKEGQTPVHENSFIVINKKGTPNYRPEGILDHFRKVSGSEPISNESGENIEQEAIIHKPFGTDKATMHNISGDDAGSSFELGKFQGDSGGEYFTELKGGRRFELR